MLLFAYTKPQGVISMKDKLLPQFLINVTIVLYRFMCRGFGKEVPKPYYGNFCGLFWAVFFTYIIPVLTPFILVATVIRLLFGKQRGEKIGNAIVASGSQIVATKTRSSITGVIIVALLAIPIVLFWAIAWPILSVIGLVIVIFALLVALATLGYSVFDSFFNKVEDFWNSLPKLVRWTLIGILLVASSPAILAFALVIGACYGAYLLYKNGCPLVQESSPKLSS